MIIINKLCCKIEWLWLCQSKSTTENESVGENILWSKMYELVRRRSIGYTLGGGELSCKVKLKKISKLTNSRNQWKNLLVAHNFLCSICLALIDRYIRVMQ